MSDFDLAASEFVASIEDDIFSGRLVFPTSLDMTIRIKRLADDPASSLEDIANAVRGEPLLAAKVVRMANAVALNPSGHLVTGVADAVRRVGLATLRCLAFAVAAEQLASDHRDRFWQEVARKLWLRSAEIACWAHALAKETRCVGADTAMFAGMIAHIGQFFLLARIGDHPRLAAQPEQYLRFVAAYHARVGANLLIALDVPDAIAEAVRSRRVVPHWPPRSLTDILALASLANRAPDPFGSAVEVDAALIATIMESELIARAEESSRSLLTTLTT